MNRRESHSCASNSCIGSFLEIKLSKHCVYHHSCGSQPKINGFGNCILYMYSKLVFRQYRTEKTYYHTNTI